MQPEEDFDLKTDPKRADQLALAQYAALREEIKWIIGQVSALENTALVFSGAVWAWIATQQWKPIYIGITLLPVALSVLFFMKRRGLPHASHEVSDHLIKMESYFNLPDHIGWEHYLRRVNVRHFRIWKSIFWPALIIFNLAVGLLMIWLRH